MQTTIAGKLNGLEGELFGSTTTTPNATPQKKLFGRRRRVQIGSPMGGERQSARLQSAAKPKIDQLAYDDLLQKEAAARIALLKAEVQNALLQTDSYELVKYIGKTYPAKQMERAGLVERLASEPESNEAIRAEIFRVNAELEILAEIYVNRDGDTNPNQFFAKKSAWIHKKKQALKKEIFTLETQLGQIEGRKAQFAPTYREVSDSKGTSELAKELASSIPAGRAAEIKNATPSLAESFWTYRLFGKNWSNLTGLEVFGRIVMAPLIILTLISDAITLFIDETVRSLLYKQLVSGAPQQVARNLVLGALDESTLNHVEKYLAELLRRTANNAAVEVNTLLNNPKIFKSVVRFAEGILKDENLQNAAGDFLTGKPLRKAVNKAIGRAAGGAASAIKGVLADEQLREVLIDFIATTIEDTSSRTTSAAYRAAADAPANAANAAVNFAARGASRAQAVAKSMLKHFTRGN